MLELVQQIPLLNNQGTHKVKPSVMNEYVRTGVAVSVRLVWMSPGGQYIRCTSSTPILQSLQRLPDGFCMSPEAPALMLA